MIRLSLAALFAVAAVGLADDPKPQTPAEKLEALKTAQKAAEKEFHEATEPLPDTEEGHKKYQELWKPFDDGQAARFMAAVELAGADPKSDFAVSALEWVLTIPRSYYLPAGKPALELAREHHARNPKVGKIAAWVGYYPPDERYNAEIAGTAKATWAFLEAVAETNPDKAARAQAELAFALKAHRAFAEAEYKKSADPDKLAAEAERVYEKLEREYGDCPRLIRENGGTVGELARGELFELRHLRVGKTAPELAGEDVDGKPLKLSEVARGKVTVVVFWASWCGPCMREVPHEKKLVERLKDDPFVLVGVNGDEERAKAKEVMAREGMGWRSFWAGPGGPRGPLAKAWNVRSWPTVYVIDRDGVIRAKNVRDKELDAAVDTALKEAGKK
ncbi:MAG: TlpA family protein disulfide reductase [Gemmataceae bacterium]|nr:TlpA family protein disulfide reductase [Gemmataceae bacterium]